jgi:GntR family transcriptional repressor for pyruvate dehydrogenase complex
MSFLKQDVFARAEPNLTDRVTTKLLDEITGGQYQTGDVLPPEQVIAERLGVSRTILREAISRLKVEGIVASKQGRGLSVVSNRRPSVLRMLAAPDDDVDELLSIVELRRGFEIEAAGFAAQRRDEADIEEMRQALVQMQQAIDSGEVSVGVEADLRFHEAIARATKNHHYMSFFDFLSELYRRNLLVSRTRSARMKGRGEHAQKEHEAIFQAIRIGDADAARGAARTHVENTGLRLTAASTSGRGTRPAKAKAKGAVID